MHTTALLTMLFAAVTSAQLNYCTGNKQTLGHCHTLSFTDVTTTTANALNSTACNDTCRTMFWDAGDWLVDLRAHLPFSDSCLPGKPEGYLQHMTGFPGCGFSMGAIPNTAHELSFLVDNQDIADIIDEVVSRFAGLHDGRVAAEGRVRCDEYEAMWYVGLAC